MAANLKEQSISTSSSSLERAEVIKRLRLRLRTIEGSVQELREMVVLLEDTPTKAKKRPATDENNEPSFEYLVPRVIPPEMYVTKRMLKYGASIDLTEAQVRAHFEDFRLYFGAGKNGPKKHLNWYAGFQVWMRRAIEKTKQAPRASRFDQHR